MNDRMINICLTGVALGAALSTVSLHCAAQCKENTPFDQTVCEAKSDLRASITKVDSALKTPLPSPADTPILKIAKQKEHAALADLESLATAPPPTPAITIHGGSVDLYNNYAGGVFKVWPHGKTLDTNVPAPANTISLYTFATTSGGPLTNSVVTPPTNWILTIYFRMSDGTVDKSKTMTICPHENGAGQCEADGNPVTSNLVYFEDGGYGQFYASSAVSGLVKYTITDACQGTDVCDHISNATVQFRASPAAPITNTPYYGPPGGLCNIYLTHQ